jgi:hypothetical protein
MKLLQLKDIPEDCNRNILFLSSRHINEYDLDAFKDCCLVDDETSDVQMIPISEDHFHDSDETVSDTFKSVYATAKRLGFSYLIFDPNAPVIKGLPIGDYGE